MHPHMKGNFFVDYFLLLGKFSQQKATRQATDTAGMSDDLR